MKILDGLRKELLKLDSAEKIAEWPKVKEQLKKSFYDLEELINKLKENGDDEGFNTDKLEAEISEYRHTVETLISQEPSDKVKIAKELIGKMDATRTILLIHLIPEEFIRNFDRQFSQIHWLNPNKAKSLINSGLSISNSNYDREKLAEIVFAIYQEMSDPSEFNTGTLG